MSENRTQQTMPVIIKGGRSGILAKPIEIQANSVFQVSEEFQQQPSEWTQSNSNFSVSYVESVMVGEMGAGLQFCQTSVMTHPLTYEFKDSSNKNIFTIKEVTNDNGGYSLQISVTMPDEYFQITEGSKSETWTVSAFDTVDAEVHAVEVIDATETPVCRLLRTNEEDIFLNLEPAD